MAVSAFVRLHACQRKPSPSWAMRARIVLLVRSLFLACGVCPASWLPWARLYKGRPPGRQPPIKHTKAMRNTMDYFIRFGHRFTDVSELMIYPKPAPAIVRAGAMTLHIWPSFLRTTLF